MPERMALGRISAKPLETLAGNRTITALEVQQYNAFTFDPGGAGRNVVLPAVATSAGLVIYISNPADAPENLTRQNPRAVPQERRRRHDRHPDAGRGGDRLVRRRFVVWPGGCVIVRYLVVHPYSAATAAGTFGPWQPGDEVNLDEADAEWVIRDSPGVLTLVEMDPRSTPTTDRGRKR